MGISSLLWSNEEMKEVLKGKNNIYFSTSGLLNQIGIEYLPISDEKYIYENPVKEFRNVLFGKAFKRIDSLKAIMPNLPVLKYPRNFIVTPEYKESVKTYSDIINDKVNQAAPEEFKSEKFFA